MNSLFLKQLLMYAIGVLLIWLAIKKKCEPSLLLPMGFGAIIVNLPNSGVLNQMLPGIGETHGIITMQGIRLAWNAMKECGCGC